MLAFEDGTVFEGRSCGADGERTGEIVFNTSLGGYQEVMTDPSYAGQIVTFTAPHVGIYGTNAADMESRGVFAAGFVMRAMSETASNWRSEEPLRAFLERHRVVAIDIANGVYEPETTELRPQWTPKLAELLSELRKSPAVLRLSYLADVEPEKLVRERLAALKQEITKQWQRSGGSYPLTIETEVFWRKGGPPKR
jgi:carbamoyl-phosphate synthase small subunit